MQMVGLMSFGAACGLLIGLELLGMIPALSIAGLGFIFVLTYFRNKLREAFEMPGANECSSMCGDCILVTCCSCCVIAQEARHVQLAAQANHDAVAAQRVMLEAPEQAV